MNPDDDRLTDALKDGIDRLMGEVEIPDGLVIRALRRRSERSRFRAMAGSATAIVAVVGLLAATLAVAPPQLPGKHHGAGGQQILTVSYVTGQVEQAMAKASSGKLVERITMSGKDARFVLYRLLPRSEAKIRFPSLDAARLRLWFYRDQIRQQGLTSAGEPLWDTVGRRTATSYGIDYKARAWWRVLQAGRRQVPAGRGCKAGAFLPAPWLATPRDWTALIRSAFRCGTYKIVQHQQIDGQAAIKLVPADRSQRAFAALRQTIWVAPSTYLPIRVEWAWPATGSNHPRDIASDFVWRKPSRASLAQLTPPVPDGFRKLGPGLSQELLATLF